MSPVPAPILEARALSKVYHPGSPLEVVALAEVDLTLSAGEITAVVGPSGSGKSTLMHLLGLLDTPTTGTVSLRGELVARPGRLTSSLEAERTRIRARELGFVFQGFNLVPTATALENVALAASYAGRSRAEARLRARTALERVELSSRLNHLPRELSGGEQQRVAIARALVNEPALLLADEPTGNLDSARGAVVLQLLRTAAEELGQSVCVVTHDAEVAAWADRVISVRDGRVQPL